MYECISRFRDLEDGHLYEKGEPFPHDGRVIPAERIAALSTTQNKAGFTLIKAVAVKVEEEPVKKVEQAKKPVRSRKSNK